MSDIPEVLGHPATTEWCASVDIHHRATEAHCSDLAASVAFLEKERERLIRHQAEFLEERVLRERTLETARAEILRRGEALVAIQDAGYSNDHYQRVTSIAKRCLARTPAILA